VVSYPGDVSAALEPKEPYELDVQTSIGGIAVLRCFATGNPAPNITWSLKNLVVSYWEGDEPFSVTSLMHFCFLNRLIRTRVATS